MRMGEAADQQLTEEFLLNIPVEYAENELFRITFNALTPEQQVNALIKLQELVQYKRQLEPVELVTTLEGELAVVMSLVIPDIMERIKFWQEFVKGARVYKQFPDQV